MLPLPSSIFLTSPIIVASCATAPIPSTAINSAPPATRLKTFKMGLPFVSSVSFEDSNRLIALEGISIAISAWLRSCGLHCHRWRPRRNYGGAAESDAWLIVGSFIAHAYRSNAHLHKRAGSLDQFHQSANTDCRYTKTSVRPHEARTPERQPGRIIRMGVQQAQCSTNSKIVERCLLMFPKPGAGRNELCEGQVGYVR